MVSQKSVTVTLRPVMPVPEHQNTPSKAHDAQSSCALLFQQDIARRNLKNRSCHQKSCCSFLLLHFLIIKQRSNWRKGQHFTEPAVI